MGKTSSKRIQKITVERIADFDADTSYLEQEGFEERLEEYKRGLFEYVGVAAKAEVVIDGICQTINSGGLWGTESDMGENYFLGLEEEQLTELRQQLLAIGFGSRAISKAMASRYL